MDSQEAVIRKTFQQIIRAAGKYARIEKLPIPVEDGVEVSTREIHTIQAIGERDQMCVTEVASHFGVTKSAASQMIKKLEEKGFVEKNKVPGNDKELSLTLTRLGWKAFDAHEKFHGKDRDALISLMKKYPFEEIDTLSVLLDALDAVMDKRLGE
jgi:DNA-binding MarR family transcriptional regulator